MHFCAHQSYKHTFCVVARTHARRSFLENNTTQMADVSQDKKPNSGPKNNPSEGEIIEQKSVGQSTPKANIDCISCGKQKSKLDTEMNSALKNMKIPPPLSAQNKSSFAYKTIKDRLPIILVKTIDFFHRQRKDLHKLGGTIETPNETELAEIEQDSKDIIAQLAKLRKELETNKSLELLEKIPLEPELDYFNDDVEAWNKTLEEHKLDDGSLPRYFDSPWLLVECYLYRKIKDTVLRTKHLKMFDPFVEQKQVACRASVSQMTLIAAHLSQVEKAKQEASNQWHPSERSEFGIFMQLALWANKSDLSISQGSADKIQAQKLATDLRDTLDSLKENILCDNMSEAWFKVSAIKGQVRDKMARAEPGESIYIDLVVDNSGYEIFVDLCFIHFLGLMFCQQGEEGKGLLQFRIHCKRMPWFVSDAMPVDFNWLINFLTAPEQDANLQSLGQKWRSFLDSGFWSIREHNFWTLPHDYSEMQLVAKDLHSLLSKSSFLIFKGDLNYRKLVGDRNWHILTPFRAALRNFTPAPLLALRTAKADVVVGIEDMNIFAQINNNELPRDWMVSGNFGLIQYVDPL